MNIIANGIIYYPTLNFNLTRRLIGFIKTGEAAHIQGEGHKFEFYKNASTGECAIKINHFTDSQLYIFSDKDVLKLSRA